MRIRKWMNEGGLVVEIVQGLTEQAEMLREPPEGQLLEALSWSCRFSPSLSTFFLLTIPPRSGMVLLGQGFQSNKVNQRKMTEWKPKIEGILMRTCRGSTPKLITVMCFSCSRPFGPLFMYEPNCI